jgi:hypothetical protein
MAKERMADQSHDVSVFQLLTEELPGADHKVAEARIKRMLRRKHLGQYDQARVDALRSLRDELRREFEKSTRSKYFQGPLSAPLIEHFDDKRMTDDFSTKYPVVRQPDIGGVIGYALYYYYCR